MERTGKWRVELLLLLVAAAVQSFDVRVANDPTVNVGEAVTLSCVAQRLSANLERCVWTSPLGDRFDDRSNNNRDILVQLSGRNGSCQLNIRAAVKEEHNGPWTCALTEARGDDLEKFVFLTVASAADLFQLQASAQIVAALQPATAERGGSVTMHCPVSPRASSTSRPSCSWISPDGKEMGVLGSQGLVLEKDGTSYTGDSSLGDCGIRIEKVTNRHLGEWTCKVLQNRFDGKLGTEVVLGSVILADRFRTDRLQETDGGDQMLQGYRDGDRKVRVIMNLTLTPEQDRDSEFYWVVQRRYLIREDDKECPKDKRECYSSTPRERLRGQADKYELGLEFEELFAEDIVDPVVLVREYRDFGLGGGAGRRQRRFQMYFVPRGDNRLTASAALASGGEGCVVNARFLAIGEVREDADLCVEIDCLSDGVISIKSLRNCRASLVKASPLTFQRAPIENIHRTK